MEFWQEVMGQLDVEAAEPVPIGSGRRHLLRPLTDEIAATKSSPVLTFWFLGYVGIHSGGCGG
jgi:hypothetical protein